MPKFTLEPVLTHRKYLEENLQKELAASKRLLAEELQKLSSYKSIKNKIVQRLHQKTSQNVSVSELLLHVGFVDKVSKDLKRQEERVVIIENEVNQKRDGLMEAMKNKRMLEQLKGRRTKLYREEVLKGEQKFYNDVGINMFSTAEKPIATED
ncbi:MAG: flagellar export protein FliJ [Deltaproteobacteria bacterium]|nr:flagellar export protein FliJ [Deltaproteobacteria bacterium]